MPAMRFILLSIICGVAIWLTTLIGFFDVNVEGGEGEWWQRGLVFLAVGAIMAALQMLVRPIVDLLALPLRILTLGLFSLVIGWLMLWLTAWLTTLVDFMELTIGGFWATLWAALFIAIVVAILSAIIPGARRSARI
jgi:putative membrane protein